MVSTESTDYSAKLLLFVDFRKSFKALVATNYGANLFVAQNTYKQSLCPCNLYPLRLYEMIDGELWLEMGNPCYHGKYPMRVKNIRLCV